MHGYGVMAAEIAQAFGEDPPTHVFAQAGVGALAAAICASFWLRWEARRPVFIVVEPSSADCVYQSLAAGHPVVVGGAPTASARARHTGTLCPRARCMPR